MSTIASQITSLTIVYWSKLRVTGLCVGNSPGTGEFPAQMASNAENVSIWWRHHVLHSDQWNPCSKDNILHPISELIIHEHILIK